MRRISGTWPGLWLIPLIVALAAGPARPQEVTPAADDWTFALNDFLPAIEACLAETPSPPAVVEDVWPMNRGMIGVRTRSTDGRSWTCVAPQEGGAVDMVDPAPEDPEHPIGPLFTPAPDEPPTGECYEHEQVFGPEGNPIGWVSYDMC
jgi:hypothetical protein